MKKKATVISALLCGLICAVSMLMYANQLEAQATAQRTEALARYGGDQVEVCVATRTIAAGEVVDAANTSTRLWLVDLLPEEPVTSLSEVAGMQATSSIIAGEVLSHARFNDSSEFVAIPVGTQALGVELGSAQAVGGAVNAGDLVDVYVSGASGAALLASKVLVVSITELSTGRFSVTLALAPEQVEEVIASTQSANVYLTLPAHREGD